MTIQYLGVVGGSYLRTLIINWHINSLWCYYNLVLFACIVSASSVHLVHCIGMISKESTWMGHTHWLSQSSHPMAGNVFLCEHLLDMCDDGWWNCWIAARYKQFSTYATLIYSMNSPHPGNLHKLLVLGTALMYFILFHWLLFQTWWGRYNLRFLFLFGNGGLDEAGSCNYT